MLGSYGIPDKREAEVLSRGEGEGEEISSLFLAPWVEHGIFGGPEAQQVPHLIAKLGEVLAQVVQIFHRGLVRALHLLPCGGQVAVNQTTHDLLVVLIMLLLQILPLLDGKGRKGIQIDYKILTKSTAGHLFKIKGKGLIFNLPEKNQITKMHWQPSSYYNLRF